MLKKLIRRGPVLGLAILAVSLALPSAATAGPVLVIQYGGMDLSYSGGQLCDLGSCGFGVGASDPLFQLTFGYDTNNDSSIDVLVGILTQPVSGPNPLGFDLDVPVPTLPVSGDASGTGGSLGIVTEAPSTPGWGLELSIDRWNFTLNGGNPFDGNGRATVVSQNLPFGLVVDDDRPWLFSWSSQVSDLNSTGGIADSFTSGGTGELRQVPEPGTLLLIGGSLAGLALLRRRRQ